MELADFRASLTAAQPPDGLPPLLRALWFEAKDDWNQAHAIIQEEDGRDSAWAHAYLHRKEGDLSNAGYWYSRAHRPAATKPLAEEWQDIVAALLSQTA